MASATGTATLDFGVAPGSQVATLAVTGQASILATDLVGCWFMGDSTADHPAPTHTYILPLLVALSSSIPSAAAGFTITATSKITLIGTVKVRWAWST